MKKLLETKQEWILARNHTEGYREYRVPVILAVEGALLMAYEARPGEGEKDLGDWCDNDIHVLRLEPGKEPELVFQIGDGRQPGDGSMQMYHNAVLIPDEHRTHLMYNKCSRQAFIVTSEDGGKSWSEPREITESHREFACEWNALGAGPCHGVQMRNGRLIVPVWLSNGEELENGMIICHPNNTGCLYSDDHGLTWRAGAVNGDLLEQVGTPETCETCVAELEDGSLLFNHRNKNPKKRRILSLSRDGGESFERIWVAEDLVDPECAGGMTMDGKDILFVNCIADDIRTNLAVKRSRDGGEHWETIWEVDPRGGYADIAVLNGQVYVIYERTNYIERQIVVGERRLNVVHFIDDIVLKRASLEELED